MHGFRFALIRWSSAAQSPWMNTVCTTGTTRAMPIHSSCLKCAASVSLTPVLGAQHTISRCNEHHFGRFIGRTILSVWVHSSSAHYICWSLRVNSENILYSTNFHSFCTVRTRSALCMGVSHHITSKSSSTTNKTKEETNIHSIRRIKL